MMAHQQRCAALAFRKLPVAVVLVTIAVAVVLVKIAVGRPSALSWKEAGNNAVVAMKSSCDDCCRHICLPRGPEG